MAKPQSATAQATSGTSVRDRVIARAGWWWALGLSALFAAFAYVALNWYTVEDDNEWVGMQGEALTNPYLAMQRTVEEMGASTRTVKGDGAWDTMLDGAPKNATLLLGDRRLVRMTQARIERIRAWVREGGNLIVEAEQPTLDDPLLASYGIGHAGVRWTAKNGLVEKREQGVPANGDEDEPDAEDDSFGFNADDIKDQAEKNPQVAKALSQLKRQPAVSSITFADNARFQVDFRPYQNLRAKKVPDDADVIDDQVGTRLVQFRDGLGRVTAISNFDFMTWRTLGKYDHAEFLWHMIATQNVAATDGAQSATPAAANPAKPLQPVILLALRDRNIGLWAWLGQHAWMVLWTFAVLLLVWIARVVRRFGPLRGDAVGARLSLGEHLRALGQYLAQQQAWPTLTQAARERFLKRLYRERPGLSRVDRASLLVTLEKLTGMGLGRIERALASAVQDRSSFVDVIRSLKAMEAMLDHRPAKGIKRQNQSSVKA